MASVSEEASERGVEQQIVLPWSRALQMTRENIFVRVGRSAITASGIFLGIAFLTAVLFSAAAARVEAAINLQKWGQETSEPEMQARIIWLAAMSLLVATVGIVNAMLMSVTERYKEIGTMKCLGALDSFIVRLFLLEAGMLGILGSITGAIGGTGIMTLVYARQLGWEGAGACWKETAVQVAGWGMPLWLGALVAVAIGGILSVLAALYPAWRATRVDTVSALSFE